MFLLILHLNTSQNIFWCYLSSLFQLTPVFHREKIH